MGEGPSSTSEKSGAGTFYGREPTIQGQALIPRRAPQYETPLAKSASMVDCILPTSVALSVRTPTSRFLRSEVNVKFCER